MNYEKIYKNIISKAQSRDKLNGYTERHHIIPKSFGGSNDDSNMVTLTAREHFLAHYCLWKFNVGQARSKMAYAFKAMSMGRYMNSRLYSEFKKDVKLSDSHKRKIGLGNKGKTVTEETKRKISIGNTGKKLTQEHIDKVQLGRAKYILSMTPAKKIARKLAKRKAYWKERELLESTT